MRSGATTVKEYLDGLPEERRKAIGKVRGVIRKHLPKGYREGMGYGMITYTVPLSVFPDTYNGQPLMYAALSSQKNHMSVYLMGCYMDAATRKRFEQAYKATGKRLDAGKSCVRFKKVEDLPLDLIGEVIAGYPVDEFVAKVNRLTPAKKGEARRG